jgi:ABC-type sugar transport system permease subunit
MGASTSAQAPGRQRSPRRRLSQQRLQQIIFILTILIPLVICFGLFWVYPVIRGFWGSFLRWRGFDPSAPFVGLRHYARAYNDPVFRISLRNTFYYTVLTVPVGSLLALLLALAIEASGSLRTWFRTFYFLPVVTSTIATALVWKWLYQPSMGLFNQLLTMAGLPTQRWLLSPQLALPSIAIYAIWKGLGFSMVIFMAGLTTISETYYDAAKVDGANRWHVFRHITLPLLQPTVAFVLITGIIGSLQVFGHIFVMSAGGDALPGGPSYATMVVVVYQWLMGFRELDLGYGSAMGLILFVIILGLTVFQLKVLKTRWEY